MNEEISYSTQANFLKKFFKTDSLTSPPKDAKENLSNFLR